jgi:hypothetical protein
VVIGAPKNDDEGHHDAGVVRVYEYRGSDAWTQIGQDLNGLEIGDDLGWYVAISNDGKTIAWTARKGNPGGRDGAGYVQAFTLDEDEWTPLGRPPLGSEVLAGDDFGLSVAISINGRRVAIGALLGGRGGNGQIYVYDYSDAADSWDPKGHVLDGINDCDGQGTSVDLSSDGNILAIGADEHDENGFRDVSSLRTCWVLYLGSIWQYNL